MKELIAISLIVLAYAFLVIVAGLALLLIAVSWAASGILGTILTIGATFGLVIAVTIKLAKLGGNLDENSN